MNILYLTHFLPYPPTTGAVQRTHHLLRQTALHHTVYLVSLNQRDYLPTPEKIAAAREALLSLCAEVQVFSIASEQGTAARAMALGFAALSMHPYAQTRFAIRAFAQAARDVVRRVKIDCIHTDTVGLASLALSLGRPAVLNHHNVESALMMRRAMASWGNPAAGLYLLLEALKIRALERRTAGRFACNLMVSQEDAGVLAGVVRQAKTAVVANGTDTEYFFPRPVTNPAALVFAGTMRYFPNRDAMLWFVNSILPLVKKERADVSLDVLGPAPPRELTALARTDTALRIRGFVPDAREVIGPAAAYIVPLRVGGGTRMKILDAFAMGKAVISTSIGAEGIQVKDGENILIADGEEGFARAVIRLLNDPELAMRLGANARRTAEKRYSWDVIGPGLCDIYKESI